jgi:hypothetical protein
MILLISASWVARITGMSHQHPAILFWYRSLNPGSCVAYWADVLPLSCTQAYP